MDQSKIPANALKFRSMGMGRKSLSGKLFGWLIGGVFAVIFKYTIPMLFNLLLLLFRAVGKVIDLLPQRWWISPISFLASMAIIQLGPRYQSSGLSPEMGLGIFVFFFVYSANYFLKKVSSCQSQAEWGSDLVGEQFYKSSRWKNLRYRFLKTTEKKCVLCGSVRGPFHVDHIKPRSKHPKLALNIDNLQLLCEPCNLGKGADDSGNTDFRKKRARLFKSMAAS